MNAATEIITERLKDFQKSPSHEVNRKSFHDLSNALTRAVQYSVEFFLERDNPKFLMKMPDYLGEALDMVKSRGTEAFNFTDQTELEKYFGDELETIDAAVSECFETAQAFLVRHGDTLPDGPAREDLKNLGQGIEAIRAQVITLQKFHNGV